MPIQIIDKQEDNRMLKSIKFTDTFILLSSDSTQAIRLSTRYGKNAEFRTTLSPALQLDPSQQYMVSLYDASFAITLYSHTGVGESSFFIYTDLVDFSYTAGKTGRLLYRTRPLLNTGNSTTGSFDPAYIQPPSHLAAFRAMHLNGNAQISTIDISIVDNNQDPLKESVIPTILTLCIRRVLPYNYT